MLKTNIEIKQTLKDSMIELESFETEHIDLTEIRSCLLKVKFVNSSEPSYKIVCKGCHSPFTTHKINETGGLQKYGTSNLKRSKKLLEITNNYIGRFLVKKQAKISNFDKTSLIDNLLSFVVNTGSSFSIVENGCF